MTLSSLERYRGALVGLACGDALGTTIEFEEPESFPWHTDIVGGGPFRLRPGQWTDDTSMALCLAESLVECGGFDLRDQIERYVRWYRAGHRSSTGKCFDIGTTTRRALEQFIAFENPLSGPVEERSAGNGSLMRLAPVPLFFAADPAHAVHLAGESSRTTHGARECIDACRYFGGLLVGAVRGESKETLLAPLYAPEGVDFLSAPLSPSIRAVAQGSFRTREPPDIEGSGYVVRSLEAALWAFDKSHDFEHGALLAVNLGDDADTTGAIYGQIAGAYYGLEGIPDRWRAVLHGYDEILELSDALYRSNCAALPRKPLA